MVLLAIITCQRVIAQSFSDSVEVGTLPNPSFKTYAALHLPNLGKYPLARPIVVAVVDDGFRLTHKAIKDYLYSNKNEIPGNRVDDDRNGYVDDIAGWDAADNDNDVSIPTGKESYFYHGTMIAGIITQIAEKCFGASAPERIKILPVKVMMDKSQKPVIDKGYEGIEYAVKAGADIIVCAWSGGKYDPDLYQRIFDEAERKGIMIIGAAGNFYSEQTDPPASISTVLSVGAIDTLFKKTVSSNYGKKVDLVAFGSNVYAPHPFKNYTYTYGEGTSSAVAMVGGCAAVLKAIQPSASIRQLVMALENTAFPVDSFNRYYGGKLGAGLPDMVAAVKYLEIKTGRGEFFNSGRSKGDIIIDKSSRPPWQISPSGGFRGFWFSLASLWKASSTSQLIFFSSDTVYAHYSSQNFPAKVFVPGVAVRVDYTGDRSKEPLVLSYSSDPTDSTTLYCKDIQYFENSNGIITDGSGDADYANNCACKWQITVPEGKRVHLDFTEMDTEPNVDFVWMYDGVEALKENMIAQFSGHTLPPIVTSRSNQVLVWFITDGKNTGKGWKLHYTAVDGKPGVIERK